ncbi:MAG TPA: hypothetical protein VFF73_00180 [Planctomycetota bacterium]|nr:hypothetical protein [Planctomycetota bacterium]
MKEFLVDFFKRYGATVTAGEREVDVALPEGELARKFGRDKLSLVFDPHDARAGIDLVAPGGHILRAIEEFLASRGRRSYVVAPRTRKLEKALVTEVLAPRRTKKLKLLMDERTDEEAWDAHFSFRLRYRGRERRDALLDVLVPVRPTEIREPSSVPPPPEATGWESHPRKRLPDDRAKEAYARALTLVDDLAAREAVELEARARARLEKDAARLEIFYDTAVVEQQTNRVATEVAQMRIEELEQERLRKRKELVESARVEAEAEPLQLLVVERPRRKVAVRVERPGAAGTIDLAFDLSTGEVEAPSCPVCKKSLARVNVCDVGHVVHEDCAAPCSTCGKVVCGACGAVVCARGGEVAGPECARLCEGCDERVCPEHMKACKVCKGDRCTQCLHRCAHCHGLACADHRLKLATGETEAQASLCAECGVLCPGCSRPEPRAALGRCEGCGRYFCATCLPLKKGEARCPSCRTA